MSDHRLKVWTQGLDTGLLAQEKRRRFVFAYKSGEIPEPVSLTMPVRLESWVTPELHPIFQMNLPEGALLESIRRAIAKLIGDDDLSILLATGGNQVGKNRFSLEREDYPQNSETPESLDEILTYPDTKDLFHELLNRYAMRSGISGVQPKVLLDATQRTTLDSKGYIVKAWGSDFPELAANEFFCMSAARKAGWPVPEFHLAENGGLFVMRRFDRTPEGNAIGFEDMCSLLGVGTAQKYSGTYEKVAKAINSYVSPEKRPEARRQFFATLVLSSIVKNGDAHLKNFGLLYSSTHGEIAMAPIYDVVTTAAYIRSDVPALSIDGSKKWWPRKKLEAFAISRLALAAKDINEIIDQTADGVAETLPLISGYIVNHPEFTDVGERMLELWTGGLNEICPQKSF